MGVRVKPSAPYRYLQLVETRREGRRTGQRGLATLGRVAQLTATGAVEVLLRAPGRCAEPVRVIAAQRNGPLEAGTARPLGPALVFGRRWPTVGRQARLPALRRARHCEFPMARAVQLTARHRLFESGAERAAARWRRDGRLPGPEGLAWPHLQRAMRWLGATKAAVEDALFLARRALFPALTLACCDPTRLDFEGQGGESLGQYGPSKDPRPARHQRLGGAVLTGEGRPVGWARWPGNYAEGRARLPGVARLRERFGIRPVGWVAARGLLSTHTIPALEPRERQDSLGARRRRQRGGPHEGLGRAGRYHEGADHLRGKAVGVEGRRDLVCHKPAEAVKAAADREARLHALADQLRQGAKRLVGTRGLRRCLRLAKGAVTIDHAEVEAAARADGPVVLRTNTTLPAAEVAVPYKRRLLGEQCFRAAKSLLETRPLFPQWAAPICGHIFCSLLALVLVDDLRRCVAARGGQLEWADIRRDLAALAEVEGREGEPWSLLRTALPGVAGQVLQAVGVASPPPVRPLPEVVPRPESIPATP